MHHENKFPYPLPISIPASPVFQRWEVVGISLWLTINKHKTTQTLALSIVTYQWIKFSKTSFSRPLAWGLATLDNNIDLTCARARYIEKDGIFWGFVSFHYVSCSAFWVLSLAIKPPENPAMYYALYYPQVPITLILW